MQRGVQKAHSHSLLFCFFGGCQEKTDVFVQNNNIFSPPARWGLLDFIRELFSSSSASCPPPRPPPRLLLLQFLLDHVCINFHLHFRLANSSPSYLPTLFAKLFANFPAQCAPLHLNLGPSQLSVRRWTSTWDLPRTSTWDLPSSVCTAGPQPGTCPAQCAPLDLNRGPSQLSVHRWTSTWDLPSSVCTAGPQRPYRMPDRIQIECQMICQIKCHEICQIECQKICQIECQKIYQIECQKICQIECQKICQNICQKICQNICQKICQIECQKICQ